MPWNSFKNLAKYKVTHNNTWKQAKDSLVIDSANKLLVQFFDDDVESKAQAIYFKKKLLTIAILSDDILHKLTEDKAMFIEAINAYWQQEVVDDLHFLS
ncbi:hypothetical protein HOD19_04130 [bacterium]|jgi:hypothetical protein|nr:hypothetical protein [bacterium]MBT4648783.1 hypothetical protein [bacterium]